MKNKLLHFYARPVQCQRRRGAGQHLRTSQDLSHSKCQNFRVHHRNPVACHLAPHHQKHHPCRSRGMAVLPYRRHLRHSQRWSQLPSKLSSIGLRSAIRQDSQRPASTLPVALRSPAVCCLCPLLYMGRLCRMDREREHLLRRNDNMLSPFGSELHILYLQDIQVAKPGRSRSPLAHYPERETPHRRHIGVVHSCRVRSTLYSVLGQSAWSAEWIFEGLSLHSPDCRHHLGWQQILRPFPRNRQREF